MRVIQNNNKEKFPKMATCQHCDSLIEIESESELHDVEVKGFDPRDGEPYSYKTQGFTCPCCGKESRV